MRTLKASVFAALIVLPSSACRDSVSLLAPNQNTEAPEVLAIAPTLEQPATLAAASCDPYQGIRISNGSRLPNGMTRYKVWLIWRDGRTLHTARAIDAISRSPSQLRVERVYASSFDVRWLAGTRGTVALTDNRNAPCLRATVTLRR